MSTDITPYVLELLTPQITAWQAFAQNFAKARILSAISGTSFADNPEEMAGLAELCDQISVSIVCSDRTCSLTIDFPDGYLNTIEEGNDEYAVGGEGGVIHTPDGGTRQSEAIPGAYGNQTQGFAREGIPIKEEIFTMLQPLFKAEIETIVNENKDGIGSILAERLIVPAIQQIGGDR